MFFAKLKLVHMWERPFIYMATLCLASKLKTFTNGDSIAKVSVEGC